jgi:hypothetical protein
MKKKIAFVCMAALLAATAFVAEAFADDDDKFRCQAIVTWNGEDVCGVDKDKCPAKAKFEAVEDACEKLCKDNDACEKDCEKSAKVVYECKDLSGNVVMSEGTVKRCENEGDKGCCKSCPKWDKPVAADAAKATGCVKPCGKPCDAPCDSCDKKETCKKHAK